MGSHIFLKSSIALGVVLAIFLSTISYGNSSLATAQDTNSGLTISNLIRNLSLRDSHIGQY